MLWPQSSRCCWSAGRPSTCGLSIAKIARRSCGLRAQKDHGAPERWFFVTDQRIGHDFRLVTAEPPLRPLSREQLQHALGDRAKVFKKPDEYRREVDARLFRLKNRYGSLLQLLIQLRQPQLARELKEDTLSRALGEALAPLDDQLLIDVADAFRALETERSELNNFTAARDAVEAFLGDYSAYLRCAARRRAAALRKANHNYEEAQRELRAKETDVGKLRAAELKCAEAVTTTHQAYIKAKAELDALEDKDAVRSLRGLQSARSAATDAANRSLQSGSLAVQAREGETHAAERLEEKRVHTRRSQTDFETRLDEASRHAATAQLTAVHTARWAPPAPPEWTEAERKSRHVQWEKALSTRAAAFISLATKIKARDEAQSLLDAAVRECSELEGRAALARETLADMRESLRTQAAETLAALRTWAAGLRELSFTGLDEMEDALERWCDQAQGEAPWAATLREAERAANTRLAAARADIARRRTDLAAQQKALSDEETSLKDGRHAPPPVPYVCGASREGRPGAAFWRTVDFHESVSAADQAGIEAALEASGLLDAWLVPEVGRLEVGLHDTWLDIDALPPLPTERSLARWLKPVASDEPTFPTPDAVARVLSVVAGDEAGEASAQIASDGRWRLGPLAGAWAKPRAEHIGELRREAARVHRLKQIGEELALLAQAQIALDDEAAVLDARARTLREEALGVPSDQALRDLGARIFNLAETHQQLTREHEQADKARLSRAETRDEAQRTLIEHAQDLRLPDCLDAARLQACRDATSTYRESYAGLVPLSDAWARAVADERFTVIDWERLAVQAAQISTILRLRSSDVVFIPSA